MKTILKLLKSNRRLSSSLLILVVTLIVLLALFPRSIEALNKNPIFGFDQGRDYLAVKNIVVNHKLVLIGEELGAGSAGVTGVFQGPFYYYSLAIPFILFKGDPVGGVYLMLFFGLVSILASFYLVKNLFGRETGLFAALLVAISPQLIAQSRFIWNPNPPTLFVFLSFYFTYLFTKHQKPLHIFLAAFFAGFIYNFEFAIALPLSAAVTLYAVYLFRKKIILIAYLFPGFICAYLPIALFEARHGFMGTKGLIFYIFHHKASSGGYSFLIDHLTYFIYNFKDSFPVNNFVFAIVFFIALISLTIYYLRLEKQKAVKQFVSFLLLLIPVNFFVFSFLRNTVWTYYLTDLTIAYIIFFSYVMQGLYKTKKNIIFASATLLVFILVVFGAINSIKTSLYDYSDYGGVAKIKGKVAAIDYVYKDAKTKQFGLLVFSPPVYTYPYDYIAWWYGEKKYNYIPYQQKKGTFYLLIEPDSSKPWSYKGWLETVIKSGRIVWTRTLPSGFIIQKRVSSAS